MALEKKNQSGSGGDGATGDLSNYATKSDLATKVTKETGKSLVDNDLIEKLEDINLDGYATETYVQDEIEKFQDTLVNNIVQGTTLNITTDKYQVVDMVNNTTIVLPTVNDYKEIHLFFTTTNDVIINMPSNIKYQKVPNVVANKTYEFIFTYTNTSIGWTFGYIEYAE